jgi:hypothetical protein
MALSLLPFSLLCSITSHEVFSVRKTTLNKLGGLYKPDLNHILTS